MKRHFLGRVFLASALICGAFSAMAQAWTEPKPGSAERKALMDAARPLAEWALSAPIEFRVDTLRVAGDRAFAVIDAQRPGGKPIDLQKTPLHLRDEVPVDLIDGPRMEVFYKKSGGQWIPVLHMVGSTDVWFLWEPICAEWRAVLSDYCTAG